MDPLADMPQPLNLQNRYCPQTAPVPEKAWLPGLYPSIVAGLIGDSTVGKSWLSLLLVHDWALGTSFTQLPIERQGRAGYLSLEDDDRFISQRLVALAPFLTSDQYRQSSEPLLIWDWSAVARESWSLRALRIRALAQQVDILVIDHLRRLHDMDENSNNDMGILLGDLQTIAKQTHTTILTIHHIPTHLPWSASKTLRGRGASVIHNTWRWCGGLQRRRDGSVDLVVLQAREGVTANSVIGRFRPEGSQGLLQPYTVSNQSSPVQSSRLSQQFVRFSRKL